MSADVERVAALLGDHRYRTSYGDVRCSCGWKARAETVADMLAEYRLHVAQAIVADERDVAAEALREFVGRVLANPTWHRGMYGCPDDMIAARDLRAAVPTEATP